MKVFRLSTWLYVGLLFALAACQPVTRRPELPTLIEHKIPTHAAHAGGITVGADGALWFAETGANQIGRISMDGIVTEYPIPTEDALDDTQGFVGLGPDGAIWFNEDRVNKLGRITPDGTITEVDLPQGMAPIRQMVAGADGALWVTAIDANKIVKLSTEGKLLAEYTLPNPDSFPVGMVAGPDGAFWFVENGANQIGRITLDGVITEYAIPTANSVPLRLTVGPDNALWFTMARANKIGRISVAGEVTEYDVPGMLPVGIAAGADGALWFTGYQSTEIGRLTVDGVLTKLSIPTYAAVPYHIVAGPDGNLWFTEQQGNQIGQIKLPAATAAEQKPVVALTMFSPKTFKLPMSVSFGTEWLVADEKPGVVQLRGHDVDLAFMTTKDAKIASAEASAEASFSMVPFPDDFVTWIQSHGLFRVVETQPVVVGGFQGIQINTIVTAACINDRQWIFPLGTDWRCGVSGDPIRFIYLDDVYGERVLIFTEGLRSEEDFMLGGEAAQKVLDTVVFPKPTTTFSSDKFRLPMSVSFDSDWHVIDDFTDLVTVASSQKDWNVGFNIVNDAKVADPVSGSQIPFPEDFASWIKSNPNFIADEPTEVMVAGIKGRQIDATPMITKKQDFLHLSGTTWNMIPSTERWRFILFNDINGARLLILLIAPSDQFNIAVEHSQKLLDTVVFTKP